MTPAHVGLGDICEVDSGPAFKSSNFRGPEEGVRLLRGENIEPGRLRWLNTRTWPHEEVEPYKRLLVASGDLILGMDRPIISTGLKLARVGSRDLPALLVQRVARIRPRGVDGRYLYHWLSAPAFAAHLQRNATGTQLPHVTLRSIREWGVPRFAPAQERLIVDILEDHLSRLDAARAYLDHALRRAVSLDAALRSETRRGPERPLHDVAAIQGGIQKQQRRAPRDNAYPFLRVANVTAQGLDLSDVHRVELFGDELNRLRLERGDLLVVEGNGSASQIGRAALWDGSIHDCVHQNHLIRVRPGPDLLPGYLEAIWNSPQTRAQLTQVASSSSGLHTLSVSKLKSLTLPVPDMEVQRGILLGLQESQVGLRRLKLAAQEARLRGDVLRRAVLAAAFSGSLTGRATDDEIIEELAQ